MLEIELKFRTDDWERIRSALDVRGARRIGTRDETDHYFNAPDRDFAQTDEALRLRRVGAESNFTYKGPRRSAATKSRLEIEVPLAAGDGPAGDAVRLLVALGFRPVAVVEKRRELFAFDGGGFEVAVCFDDVTGVGRFVELEVVADEDRFESAQAVVLAAAADLGLTQVEPRSYLRLFLEGRPVPLR